MYENEYKPIITVTDKEITAPLNIHSKGVIELAFSVVGVNTHKDEDGNDCISYTLEYRVEGMSVKKMNLEQAAERAASPIPVKNSINPAP